MSHRTDFKHGPHLHIIDHPLLADLLGQIRDRETPAHRFRHLLAQAGELIAYEATRDLPTQAVAIETPMEPCTVRRLRQPMTIVPILRAGLGMAQGVHHLFPDAHLGHIGMFRDEQKLQPVTYYEKLPARVADGPVLLVDPMLATGGSAAAAIDLLRQRGCQDVRLLCLIAAPEGVRRVLEAHPLTPVYAADLDRQLNERGFILPGLGDAGDRQFGTA